MAGMGGGGYSGRGVSGPASSTDNAVARWNAAAGNALQDTSLLISDNNEVTNANQPAFFVHNSATDADVTGAGAVATVDFDTEIFDQGANFATDTFTAPVTGRYFLQSVVRVGGLTAGTTDNTDIRFVTSNRTIAKELSNTDNLGATEVLHSSVVADLDANDTVTIAARVMGEATDIADVLGGSAPITWFSGCLLA